MWFLTWLIALVSVSCVSGRFFLVDTESGEDKSQLHSERSDNPGHPKEEGSDYKEEGEKAGCFSKKPKVGHAVFDDSNEPRTINEEKC